MLQIQCLDMDPLAKIRIGHDNSGQGGSWHLDFVEITNRDTGQRYHFPCRRWFSKEHEDGLIERDIFPGQPAPPLQKAVVAVGFKSRQLP